MLGLAYMEIAVVALNCLKIKGKKGSFVIDPLNVNSKTEADAVIFFSEKETADLPKIEGYRVVISSPGEYEVSGIKISGSKSGDGLIYQFYVDGVNIVLANASVLEKAKDKLSSHNILLLNADTEVSISAVTTLEPEVVVVYGENASKLEKEENVIKASKYSTTKDKLPEKMETVLLS